MEAGNDSFGIGFVVAYKVIIKRVWMPPVLGIDPVLLGLGRLTVFKKTLLGYTLAIVLNVTD